MTTVHLIDGTFELFRAHFSKRPDHVRPDGAPFKAVAGLASSLLALLHDAREQVTHVAIAFDNPIRSFRNDLFPGYKSDEFMDPELRAQFDDAERAARALGITVWSMDRWEADDALATGARRFAGRAQVRILSPDKDMGQCLGPDVVQVDRIRERVIDVAAFREARGIEPESLPDLLALVGDSADGIPGLPGWGEKSAATVLRRHLHLDAIPDDPAAWDVPLRGRERLAEVLAARRADAALYRILATTVTDVPLAEDLEDLRWAGVPREPFAAWCAGAGLDSLGRRPTRWA